MRSIWMIVVLSCSAVSAQSIVMSGSGGSIVVSGQSDSSSVVVSKPVVVAEPPKPIVQPSPKPRQFYLVSESWCQHCPAAKRRFLAKGWPERNVLTIAECKRRFGFTVPSVPYEFGEPVAAKSVSVAVKPMRTAARLPVVQTQWGTIDLQTYQRNCNCPMCQGIRSLQQQYRQSLYSLPTESLPPPQEPTPNEIIETMLPQLNLEPSSVLADFGCGDGRILIAAVERYGCTAIGIEIDPIIADTARRRVADSGLSSRIQIVTADVRNYDPAKDRVTHAVAYLYPALLNELAATLSAIPVVASPFHEVPGLGQKRIGDVWIR